MTGTDDGLGFVRRLAYGLLFGGCSLIGGIIIGLSAGKLMSTISLLGTSILFEAQPAAVASLPLGFHPFSGAVISILGNLILLPILMLTLEEIVNRWTWFRRKLQKANKWSEKYGKYGVWVLILLSPIVGAYVCVGIGYAMRWRPGLVLCSVLIGVVISSFFITYGGESVVKMWRIFA